MEIKMPKILVVAVTGEEKDCSLDRYRDDWCSKSISSACVGMFGWRTERCAGVGI